MANVIVRNASYAYEVLKPAFFEIIEKLIGNKIKSGDKVLIKPNMLTFAAPDDAVLTHPLVIKAAVEYVLEKSARPQVSDSPGMGSFDRILKVNGTKAALAGLNVICKPFKVSCKLDIGKPYGNIDIAQDAADADVIINLPKLKTHTHMLLTLGVKNMFGCIVGFKKSQWHMRAGVDAMAFARLLVGIHEAVRPTASILDGILALEGEGPGKAGKPRSIGILVGSCNTFALDMTICKMIGIDYMALPTLKVAQENNLIVDYVIDGQLPVVTDFLLPRKERIVFGPRFLQNFLRKHTQPLPVCDKHLCQICGKCWTICPAKAIRVQEAGIEFDYGKCIRCYCCIEICPYAALRSKETIGGKIIRKMVDKFS
jgi:uncharacterized protein (DUF362 family)/Pyruvate/2-oxoacid:ferredoxin oxidoreductase delta subunit